MIRLASPATVVAALAMAGCTTYYDPPPKPAPAAAAAGASSGALPTTVSPGSFRPGNGIVESISLAQPPASAAAAGGTAAVSGPYRLTMRMDDGSTQTLTVDTRAILVGDRLQITPEGRLIRL